MTFNVTEKIKYIGVDDITIDLFESQYIVPNGDLFIHNQVGVI